MSEPTLILQNMRGGCATVGDTVHTLFRFNGRPRRQLAVPGEKAGETISARDVAEAIRVMAGERDEVTEERARTAG